MNKDYINFGKWEGVLRVKFHWLEVKAFGMPCLIGEIFQESQVFAGQVLIGKWEAELLGLPKPMQPSSGRRLGVRPSRQSQRRRSPVGKGSPPFSTEPRDF